MVGFWVLLRFRGWGEYELVGRSRARLFYSECASVRIVSSDYRNFASFAQKDDAQARTLSGIPST
jgi:hypothetical protein